MSKMEKLQVYYMSMDSLLNAYKNNNTINFENLGIITDQKIILCKLLYTKHKIVRKPYSLYVDKTSYYQYNLNIIKYIIEYFITMHSLGKRESTITSHMKAINYFFKWLNTHNLTLDNSLVNTKDIFLKYTYYLKNKIRLGQLSVNTASHSHRLPYKILHGVYDDKENYILDGHSLIQYSKKSSKKTLQSPKSEQRYHYTFYFKLFNQIADFILEHKKYPFKLNLIEQSIWCLPSSITFYRKNAQYPQLFNPEYGTIRTIEEINKLYYTNKESKAKYRLDNFIERLENSNKLYSNKRLQLASHGIKAFFILFLTNTGMNDSTAATLQWSDNYKIDKEQYKFSNFKYRAGNKHVDFQLKNKFVKYFKKFLLLREYILNGSNNSSLFFIYHHGKINTDNLKKGSFSAYINKYFKKHIDPNLPVLNSKILRVNKITNVIKNDGIVASSQIAQTEINTILSNYQGKSLESTEVEFSEYFMKLNQHILTNEKSKYISTPIGHCRQQNTPKMIIKHDNFDDCTKSEGCLFCANYCIHADKEDIYKIFSLKYVINECKYIAKDIEHFNSIYSLVIKRLDNIINTIIDSDIITKDIIQEYENDVFVNENLHPFWEHKLQILYDLGVLK